MAEVYSKKISNKIKAYLDFQQVCEKDSKFIEINLISENDKFVSTIGYFDEEGLKLFSVEDSTIEEYDHGLAFNKKTKMLQITAIHDKTGCTYNVKFEEVVSDAS